jgi:demethylmenaquinone methyltransferase / 2-methoxy-6-polyprenyl-1,4-benzoquinol methylase
LRDRNATAPPVLPPPDAKRRSVRQMFSDIAPRYDLLNRLLTLAVDRRWRRRAVDHLVAGAGPRGRFLDACAGTMDLAAELAGRREFEGVVIAADFAWPMLERGRVKVIGLPVRAVGADALALPHPDGALDGAIVGFGVRNFEDVDAGLRELARVLRPGAPLVILELSVPPWRPLRHVYFLYFTRILPWIGRLVSRHHTAYSYLPASVQEFPAPAELARRMTAAGFMGSRFERLLAGVAAIHVGERAAAERPVGG